MENEIYGYIYLITNLVNNKQYVGQTVTTIKIRFNKHRTDAKYKKTYIEKAINKHGIDNFIVQELTVAYDQKELNLLEGIYMSRFKTLTPNGYNIKEIIDGKGKNSEETREKMRIAQNKPKRIKQQSEIGKLRRGQLYINSTSCYIGVSKIFNKYSSRIMFNNKEMFLGYYNSEITAAKAYDLKALNLFGLDCTLNFPELKEDYVNGKIIVNKNSRKEYSKSKEAGIRYNKKHNKWILYWFDLTLKRNKTKYFIDLNNAIEFKTSLISNNNFSKFKRI